MGKQGIGLKHHVDRAKVGRSIDARSLPSSKMVPLVGVSKPASMRSRVDLPQPDGPSRAKNSLVINFQGEIVDGGKIPKPFGNIPEFDNRIGVRLSTMARYFCVDRL